MNKDEAKQIVLHALLDVAPDLAGTQIADDADLRRNYDIDSADYLAFIIKLHTHTGRDIPEADYPKLATLARAADYLAMSSTT
jgi:acyl carrier protein